MDQVVCRDIEHLRLIDLAAQVNCWNRCSSLRNRTSWTYLTIKISTSAYLKGIYRTVGLQHTPGWGMIALRRGEYHILDSSIE